MAEQTITLPIANFVDNSTHASESQRFVGWVFVNNRPQIDSSLAPAGTTRYLEGVRLYASGQITLNFEDAITGSSVAGKDLTSLFETQGSFITTSGSNSVTIETSGIDTSDPYVYPTPPNADEVTAFYDAFDGDGDDAHAGTLILRDFVQRLAGAWEGTKITGGAWESTKLVGGAWGDDKLGG